MLIICDHSDDDTEVTSTSDAQHAQLAQLHLAVDQLFPGRKRCNTRSLIHALIDLGQVTAMQCAWSACVIPQTPLAPAGRSAACATIDHIVALNDGGSDHWSNLQLLHNTCNNRKGALFTDERRARLSMQSRQRWKDPAYREKTAAHAAFGGRSAEARAKRSQAMKKHWSDPARKAAHLVNYPRGDDHWMNKPGARDPVRCTCGKVCKGLAALRQHQTKMGCAAGGDDLVNSV